MQPDCVKISKRRVHGMFGLVAAAVAGTAAWVPAHGPHLVNGRAVSAPRFFIAPPSVNRSLAKSLGPFAFANSQGLWMTTAGGELVYVSANTHALNPSWSANGLYLAYETSGPNGADAKLNVYSVRLATTIYHQLSVYGMAWQPGHNVMAVWGTRSAVLSFSNAGAKTLGTLPVPHGSIIWTSTGQRFIYSRTLGAGAKRYDQVYAVSVSGSRLGKPQALFRSAKGSGLLPAASFSNSHNLLYWPDPQFSASLLADGTTLQLWHADSGTTSKYLPMLPYPDYLAFGPKNRWAYMAGGPRAISGGKSVVLVQNGRAESLAVPTSVEALEPAMNAKTGALAAVLAQNNPNAAWGLGKPYRTWGQTRRLAIWERGIWTIWPSAGRGVTDPVWLPNGRGILYLANNRLWVVRGAHTPPQMVIGPIPSAGGYYGEILRSSLWSLHP